ncbi:uncharacterized protein BT62DRAFT_935347 [Guyanagaster necrorhizus]|uniref:DUF6534 domain-containing protein n=1 Tax=Guyanagaster necrorhizus TaxID=856835 RepID=A0A9P7VKX6_9AGAR|nr:uncharacterized protein BT62DRAFT_935347 [Guyanagaster necrorhizus MCA 3950]KAG7443026.1 hypothetical protein BT62DRAFT_935347 [Guyanagaster necrorhizus MCA 3950]
MSSTSDASSLAVVEKTFGVLFIGFVISMIGYGFTFFQTYLYFNRYDKDSFGLKAAVAMLWTLDTISSGLMSQSVYYYLVTTFPYGTQMTDATRTFCVETLFSALSIFMVQLFYSTRVWKLGGSVFSVFPICLLATVGFGLEIAVSALMFVNPEFEHLYAPSVKPVVAAAQTIVFGAAVYTVGALTFFCQWADNTPIQGWFNQVKALCFSHGLVAAAMQLSYLIAFVASPTYFIWIPFHLLTTKLFINCLLFMLNSRQSYHGHGLDHEDSSTSSPSNSHVITTKRKGKADVHYNIPDTRTPINIEVARTVEHAVDERKAKASGDSTYDDEITEFDFQIHKNEFAVKAS